MFGILVVAAFLLAIAATHIEVKRLHEAGRIGLARRRSRKAEGASSWIAIPPQDVVSDLGAVALVAGIIGARLFHILEHAHEFLADPLAMIFTRSGFSVFGGLIVGTVAGALYARKHGLPIREFSDAVAPAMMLGYAIGRIGCQVSGDGDWGIAANMALKPDWLAEWFWAQTYDNNIFGELIAAPGVYPTPIYETLMGLAGFGILWAFRKHPFQAGWLFSLYLLLSGVERFVIEQIRVNPALSVFGVQATQAELIAIGFMALGVIGLILTSIRTIPGADSSFK
jgi:phosphatidylglycerol:prolipoprotein diacylglycerol transferase